MDAGQPRFITSESSSNVSVSTGTRANLHCTIENAHRRTVSWVTLRNLSSPGLLAVGQFVFTTDQRVSVTRAPALRRWTLSITNALVSDSGWYECQVNTEPHTGHRVHLQVIEPSCSIPGEAVVYLNVGSSHTINCTVSSPQPPDHIFWFFNHRPLPPATTVTAGPGWSQVRLSEVRESHSGQYECRPSNCHATNTNNTAVTLVVLDGELRAAMQANTATVAGVLLECLVRRIMFMFLLLQKL